MTIQPWITCLQSGILIRHLEARYPEQASKVDLQRVMGAADSFQEIQDARAFLTDASNWVPVSVFRELIKACELASGEKDFTYQAALAYYETVKTQTPTLIETIAILFNDVESVFRSVGDWASAYTNYLQLQSFVCPDETQTLHILSRNLPPVDPGLGNMRLVQGNIEGIAKLDPSVETAACEEAYSQLRLETLVNEFGDAYDITTKNDRVTVARRSTGEVVITRTHDYPRSRVGPGQRPIVSPLRMVPTNNLSPQLSRRIVSLYGRLEMPVRGSERHTPQADDSLHRYSHRTRRHPLGWLTQHHDQSRRDIQRALYPLSPALDESPSTREQCRCRRSLAILDGPARLRTSALYPFEEPTGDASTHAHHVPPQCGTGTGEYPTEAGAVCAARNRRHHRQERSASRSSFPDQNHRSFGHNRVGDRRNRDREGTRRPFDPSTEPTQGPTLRGRELWSTA